MRGSCWRCGACSQNQRDVRTAAHMAPVWYLSPPGHPALAGTCCTHPPTQPENRHRDCKTSVPERDHFLMSAAVHSEEQLPAPLAAKAQQGPLCHIPWEVSVPQPGQGSGDLSHTHHINKIMEKRGVIRVRRKLKQNQTPRPENKTSAQRNQSQC